MRERCNAFNFIQLKLTAAQRGDGGVDGLDHIPSNARWYEAFFHPTGSGMETGGWLMSTMATHCRAKVGRAESRIKRLLVLWRKLADDSPLYASPGILSICQLSCAPTNISVVTPGRCG